MSAYKCKYSWKSGYSYKTSAQTVGEVLEQIEAEKGGVTSRDFLEVSRPVESATHSMFEWNDSIAAEKFRLSQASMIIHQVEVHIESGNEERTAAAFVNIVAKKPTTEGSYVNVMRAMDNDEMRAQVLANAYSELKSFEKKYKDLSELKGVMDAIRKVTENEKSVA